MKAVLSNRIFMEASPEYIEEVRKKMTYTIPALKPGDPPSTIRNMALVKPGIISIPSGRTDLIPEEYEIVDKRVHSFVDFPDFQGSLRPSQQAIYDEIEDSAIINAWVSFGKTFTALAIAGLFGQKTLVVCHTVSLRNQWVKEVEKVYGFTPGIIGSGHYNTSKPITIGNVQTLYKIVPQIKKTFGTVVMDEMHHCSSPTFSRILDQTHARYKLGLSGTLQRKDGKHVVFRDYFSNKVFIPPKENYMIPCIHIYKSSQKLLDGKNIPWAKRINVLTSNEDYRHYIALMSAAYAAKGHSVLVVSDRVEFLEYCAELVGDKAVCITGKTGLEERERLMDQINNGSKKVLFGTQSMFSEGVSVNTLSCLILSTPINNESLLTQLIGRVIREKEGKLQPIIADINLVGRTAKRQAQERLGYYMKQGWELEFR